ncbi:hypothetical protein VCB98_00550 [Gammaproteobacteria bacterium AB-CW1]|uniref:Alginate export domain-containing protein n=1 Tax=Natronospira elongata TaxID=3110268 RepID=A0AAP6JDC0_9GAMM|nr:hypothetical protein [Gammaproteobacteria bacterium AB-CW1]
MSTLSPLYPSSLSYRQLRLLIILLTPVVVAACATPMHCDEQAGEAYMDPRIGEPLLDEDGEPIPGSERFRVPGEETARSGHANPCLAMAPRLVEPPVPPAREVEEGASFADVRYRLEVVDEDGFSDNAEASTFRLRVRGTTPRVGGFDAGLAFQTLQIVGEPRFEDTTDRPGNFPTVRDPKDTAVSEGWGRFVSREDTFEVKLGRQAIRHDNERFIGSDSFRQLEQTFNAFGLRIGTGERARFLGQYIDRINTVLGPNHPDGLGRIDSRAAVLDLDTRIGDNRMGIYFHNLRFDEDEWESHRNYGLRLTGPVPWTETFSYRLEAAVQQGVRGEGPDDDLGYQHVKLKQELDDWSWYVGRERLGGDREWAFQTPLASLHEFNGKADRFLVTPEFGLIDVYAGVGFQRWGWDFDSRFHQFQVDQGSGRYGEELSLGAGRELWGPLRLNLGLSHYMGEDPDFYPGDEYAADRTRAWFSVSARFEP